MATREPRLAEFSTEPPSIDAPHQLVCEDHAGTYALRFPCRWDGAFWINSNSGLKIEARAIGWRPWSRRVALSFSQKQMATCSIS
jgi:hypothetical protein